jgi:hypothetical protein
MKIKKPLLLPLLAAVVLPFVCVLPTSAHSAFQPRLSLDSGSGSACKPIVQISRHHLNFFEETIRLEVSPCAIAALQQDGAITLQDDATPDNSFKDQTLKAVTPAIKQGLLWRMNDILTTQQSCPGSPVSLSSPIYPFLGPVSLDIFIRNMLPSVNIGSLQTNAPFTCPS